MSVGVKGSNRYGRIIDRLTFVLAAFAFKEKLRSRDIFNRFLSDFNKNQCVLVLFKMDIYRKSSNKV